MLRNVFPKLSKETAGYVAIPESLSLLKDRDLAQRLATLVLGTGEKDTSVRTSLIEVVTSMNFQIANETPHEVALVKITSFREDESSYSYHDLLCSHDLVFQLTEGFGEDKGKQCFIRTSSSGDKYCPAKNLMEEVRIGEVKREYLTDDYYDKSWQFWRKGAEEKIIVDLVKRHAAGEWIGLASKGNIYVQHLQKFFDASFTEVERFVQRAVFKGAIARDGNVLFPGSGEPLKGLPSRLYATYRDDVVTMDVYLQSDRSEKRAALVKIFQRGKFYDEYLQHFNEPLTSEGLPSPEDENLLRRFMTKYAFESRNPFLTLVEADLTLVKDAELFKNEGIDPDLPSWNVGTEVVNEKWAISTFLPNSDVEYHEAYLVAHKPDEVPAIATADHLKKVKLHHEMMFGLDGEDDYNISEAIKDFSNYLKELS